MQLEIIKKFTSLKNPQTDKKIKILVGVFDKYHFNITDDDVISYCIPSNLHDEDLPQKNAVVISFEGGQANLDTLAKLITAILKTNYRLTNNVSLNITERTGISLDPDIFDAADLKVLVEELQKEENNFCFLDSVV